MSQVIKLTGTPCIYTCVCMCVCVCAHVQNPLFFRESHRRKLRSIEQERNKRSKVARPGRSARNPPRVSLIVNAFKAPMTLNDGTSLSKFIPATCSTCPPLAADLVSPCETIVSIVFCTRERGMKFFRRKFRWLPVQFREIPPNFLRKYT